MRCCYINLDTAADRRAAIEASFKACAPQGWEMARFSAVGAAEAASRAGNLPDPMKACLLSHQAVLRQTPDDQTIFVLEDDVVFSRRCFGLIEAALANSDWDVLFTDMAVPDPTLMVGLARERRGFANTFRWLEMAGTMFSGASAYLVRPQARRLILNALDAQAALELPYDLFLRQLADQRRLRFRCIFPFVTTISGAATQLQPVEFSAVDLVLDGFRRMMFVDCSAEEASRIGCRIDDALGDPHTRAIGALLGAMTAERYAEKRVEAPLVA